MKTDILHRAEAALVGLSTDALVACYADDFVFEDSAADERITTREDLRAYFQRLFALPDVGFSDVTIHDCGTWAAIEWTWSGTVRGTDRTYRVRGASVIELRGDRIARETIYYDPRPALL